MTTYRLGSANFVNSLGMVQWGINGYHFANDRPQIRRVFTEGWNIPVEAVDALLSKTAPYTVEGDDENPVVVFTVGEAK